MKRVVNERSAEADEERETECVRVAAGMGDAEQVTIIFTCESRGDERAGFISRLNNEHRVGEPDHEAIALRKEVHARSFIRFIFREYSAARFQNFFCEAAIAPRIEHIVSEPGAGQCKRVEPGSERCFMRACVDTKRQPTYDRDRVARETSDKFLARFLPIACHRAATDDGE